MDAHKRALWARPAAHAGYGAYSSLTPALLITPPQRSISARISGWRSTSLMSALILSTIRFGVFGGATTAYHVTASKPGSVSAMAGTSGRDAIRFGVATPRSLSCLPLSSARDTP